MRTALMLASFVLVFAHSAHGQVRTDADRHATRSWIDPDLGGGVVEGVVRDGHLWLRGASRQVVQIDRETGERRVVATEVVDLLSDGPHLWTLVAPSENDSAVRDLLAPATRDRRLHFEGTSIALFTTDEGVGVLTTERVLLPDSTDGWTRRRLAASLDRYGSVSPLVDDSLFVGYDKGEWGGGLRRIDAGTGTISIVTEASDELCGGKLNPECDPVVGVVADDKMQNCVSVGASLAHMSGRYGEVLRVCGDHITSVFSDALPVIPNSIVNRPGQTWPFDNFVAAEGGWVAVGQDRFARSRNGAVTTGAVPPLKPLAGLYASEAVDGVIFVEAACCWGSDLSVQYRVIAIPVE